LDKILGSLVWNTAFLLCCQISEGYRKKTCKYSSSKFLTLFHSLFVDIKKTVPTGCKKCLVFPYSNLEVLILIPGMNTVMELFLFSKTIPRKVLK
jgi:hypothetical protein